MIDAVTVPDGTVLRADVCVVGSGPCGLSIATKLASPSCKVIVLESGTATVTPEARDLAAGEQAGDLWEPLQDTRARVLGGTSRLWTGLDRGMPHDGLRSHPLTRLDFQHRPWVADSEWPFGLETVAPFFEQAHRLLSLGDFDYGPPADLPVAFERGEVETTQVRFSSRDAIERMEAQAKASPNLDLMLGATVLELSASDAGIDYALVHGSAGRFQVAARQFVLAAGGIENARLLLLSNLGDGGNVTGRYFMEHLTVSQGLIVHSPQLTEPRFHRHASGGVPGQAVWRLAEPVVEREELLGVILAPIPADKSNGRFFARNAYLRPLARAVRRPSRLYRHVRQPWELGRLAYRGFAGTLQPQPFAGIHAHIEQPPRRENRVILSDQVDRLGQRRARLEWRIGEQERHSLLRTLTLFDAALQSKGLGRLARLPDDGNFDLLVEQSHHHMGTTRMHSDPSHGVVDADCRVHGVANLYIAGSSVMPTGGAATVTLTAVALALRLADHLKARLNEKA